MDRAELAAQLAAAGDARRDALLASQAKHPDIELARALKELYFATNTSEPQRAAGAAAALVALDRAHNHPEIHALAAWVDGMAALQIEGRIERAIERIDQAGAAFERSTSPRPPRPRG